MKNTYISLMLLSMTACTLSHEEVEKAKKSIVAADQAIEYVGRVKKADNGAVSFDWAGVYARTEFTGSYLAMKAGDSKYSEFNVYVDGEFIRKVDVRGNDSIIVLADSLEAGNHKLILQKRTEGMEGRTTISEFLIDQDAQFSPITDTPKRMIEFIGNSITCGYGTECCDIEHPYDPRTANANMSFGAIISRYFDADYALTSHSGQGVARNWSEKNAVSEYTMRERFLKTFDEGDEDYDFKCYTPDMVVISLGTNDFSEKPCPSKQQFQQATLTLISHIRNHYGQIPVLLVSPLAAEPTKTYIKDLVENTQDKNLYMCLGLDEGFIDQEPDYGPSYHPTYTGHQKMAMTMIPYISKIMKWPLQNKAIM